MRVKISRTHLPINSSEAHRKTPLLRNESENISELTRETGEGANMCLGETGTEKSHAANVNKDVDNKNGPEDGRAALGSACASPGYDF